jgi:hypothetical protein
MVLRRARGRIGRRAGSESPIYRQLLQADLNPRAARVGLLRRPVVRHRVVQTERTSLEATRRERPKYRLNFKNSSAAEYGSVRRMPLIVPVVTGSPTQADRPHICDSADVESRGTRPKDSELRDSRRPARICQGQHPLHRRAHRRRAGQQRVVFGDSGLFAAAKTGMLIPGARRRAWS